jgi:CheY-like chemotaxis protein
LPAKAKILAVDDESGITEFVQYMLQNAGFEVKTASGGWEAWDLIAGEAFDFVISDIRMDKGDGVELAEKIREMSGPKPKIALMSAYTDISLPDVYDRGAVALIQKPARSELLIKTVEHAVIPEVQRWSDTAPAPLTSAEPLRHQFSSLADAVRSGELQTGNGGLFISCSGPLPLADAVTNFIVTFTGGEPGNLQGAGIVRWVRSRAHKLFYPGFGLELLRLTPDSLPAVKSLIDTTDPGAFIPVGQIPASAR